MSSEYTPDSYLSQAVYMADTCINLAVVLHVLCVDHFECMT